MSLLQGTALSLMGQKDLALETEHHLQKITSHALTVTDKNNSSGDREKLSLNNKDSP